MNTSRLAGLNGRQIVRALQRGGFEVVRISGSHHVRRKPDDPSSKVIVPIDGSKDIPLGTVRSIVKQSGLTIEEFSALL